MQLKIPLTQAILCEGKYDAIRLSALFDTLILPAHGFRIFKDAQFRAFLSRIAARRGLIVATDSDSAGFQIRTYVKSFIPNEQLRHVVVPAVPGKERRKDEASKAGILGVEGLSTEALVRAFDQVIVMQDTGGKKQEMVSRTDLYRDGFSGAPGCRERYRALLRALDLPELLTANVFCACVTKEEYERGKESCV